jgi:hypothetical protein
MATAAAPFASEVDHRTRRVLTAVRHHRRHNGCRAASRDRDDTTARGSSPSTADPDEAGIGALAAIDVGTNSVHLLVARPTRHHRFEVLASEKEVVRLGSGSSDMKELAHDAMDRGIGALTRFRRLATTWDADVIAVATSAVREAANAAVFLERARTEADVEVDVISGQEEARLIHLGVLQAVPVYDRQLLLVDIGGGSTEILVGLGESILVARSLKLGAIRLTERFFPGGKVTGGSVDACRKHVRAQLSTVVREVRRHGYEVAVGSSGTIGAIAQMAQAARGESTARTLSNVAFTRRDLKRWSRASPGRATRGTASPPSPASTPGGPTSSWAAPSCSSRCSASSASTSSWSPTSRSARASSSTPSTSARAPLATT